MQASIAAAADDVRCWTVTRARRGAPVKIDQKTYELIIFFIVLACAIESRTIVSFEYLNSNGFFNNMCHYLLQQLYTLLLSHKYTSYVDEVLY